MNDDNISILCDRTNAPFYSYPRVFKRSKVMDDGMFESFLNETKVRPTKDQDLANNPYGIERWEFAEVFDTYCVETAIGKVFLTQKQKEEFEPLIKVLNEQQEAEKVEQQRIEEEARLAKQKEQQRIEEEARLAKQKEIEASLIANIDNSLGHIKRLIDGTSKMDLKIFGADITIAVDYDKNVSLYQHGFYVDNNANLRDIVGKALKPFVPFNEYKVDAISNDSVTLIFEVVGKKNVITDYKIVVTMKNGAMCINDFDINKATVL